MWERSGGNAGVVDRLVAMWNEKNPDRKIVLTYIHTPRWWRSSRRRSPRASSRPDGARPDLRSAVRGRGAARRHHRLFQGRPDAENREPGSHDRRRAAAGGSTACRSTPTSQRSSTTRTCSSRPGSTRTSRRRALPRSANTPTRSRALGSDDEGYFLPGSCAGCNIFTVGPLMWASALRSSRRTPRTSRSRARGSSRSCNGPAT